MSSAKGSITQEEILTAFIGDVEIDKIYVGNTVILGSDPIFPEQFLGFYTPED